MRRTGCCLPGLREVGPSPGSRTRPPVDQGCPSRPLGPSLGPPPGLHAPFFLCPWVSAPSGHCARVCTLACKSGQQAVCTLRSAALRTRLGSAGQLLAQLSDPESQEGCPPGGASTPHPALSSPAWHPHPALPSPRRGAHLGAPPLPARLCPPEHGTPLTIQRVLRGTRAGRCPGDPAEQGPRKLGAQGS